MYKLLLFKVLYYYNINMVYFQLLSQWLHKDEKQFGGSNVIVEIDEAKIGKRKYNKGRIVHGQWIFGGYERGSGRIFVLPVLDRTSSTLINIIKKKIAFGTTIYSDKWKGYDSLNQMNYKHYTVNHSTNFVDPKTGVHTQNIERTWRDLRSAIPKYGLSEQHYDHYLAEFLFKKTYDYPDRLDAFFNIMSQIYPLNENVSDNIA